MRRLIFGLLAFATGCVNVAIGGETLRVESARPVLEAVRVLEARHGWAVSYEDPPYTSADVVDRTPVTYNGPGRVIEPRGGVVAIRYQLPVSADSVQSAAAVLQMVLDDHARRGNPGRFRIRVVEDFVCVVPAQGSILDVPVTLPPAERTLSQTVEELVRALSNATGIYFREPVVPRGIPGQFAAGAAPERAAEVLLRLSKSAGHRFSWALLYIPGSGFELNIKNRD